MKLNLTMFDKKFDNSLIKVDSVSGDKFKKGENSPSENGCKSINITVGLSSLRKPRRAIIGPLITVSRADSANSC